MTRRILQFGTSRFLQAHVDLFVHEARESGQDVGPITVVQTSGSADRAGRVAAFGRPGGFPVIIRGIEDGRRVERRIQVTSVDRGLAAVPDWEELSTIFTEEAEILVSNMGDTGYAVAAADRDPTILGAASAPASFPGKLLALMHRRWRGTGRPLTVLPCELLNRNGRALEAVLHGLAKDVRAPAAFVDWMARAVTIADTLVDRIVKLRICIGHLFSVNHQLKPFYEARLAAVFFRERTHFNRVIDDKCRLHEVFLTFLAEYFINKLAGAHRRFYVYFQFGTYFS